MLNNHLNTHLLFSHSDMSFFVSIEVALMSCGVRATAASMGVPQHTPLGMAAVGVWVAEHLPTC
jgi:hypothetical protein